MNTINTTQVIDPNVRQPFTTKSLDFLQNSNKEMQKALAYSLIESAGYNPLTLAPYALSDSFIFYNGEIYVMDAILGGNNIAVLSITNDATADPLLFTDGTLKNVHNVRKIIPTTGTLGTGLFNLSDLIYINDEKYKAYVPTLLAFNSSNALVAGGFTASSKEGYYKFKNNTLELLIKLGGIVTLSTVEYLQIPIPVTVVNPKLAIGNQSIVYNDGTTSFMTRGSVYLNFTGSGNDFEIRKIDGTAFGARTAGGCQLQMNIFFTN